MPGELAGRLSSPFRSRLRHGIDTRSVSDEMPTDNLKNGSRPYFRHFRVISIPVDSEGDLASGVSVYHVVAISLRVVTPINNIAKVEQESPVIYVHHVKIVQTLLPLTGRDLKFHKDWTVWS